MAPQRRDWECPSMEDAENREILRLAGRHLLDHIVVARLGFDLLDALILVTITQANVEPIHRDAELQRRYAAYANVPPDDLRRPISINAVAQSLNMAFETVRRRVLKMSLLGLVKVGKQGVYTPTSTVSNPRHRRGLESAHARVRSLQADLDARGWDEAPGAKADHLWTEDEPLRLVGRISGEYMLRLVHMLIAETGDPVSAAVWLAVYCDYARMGTRRAPGPMSTAALSRNLRLSGETTRRRVHALAGDGLLVNARGGVVVDEAILARPKIQTLLTRNRQDVRRMFGLLSDHGVVQAWRAAALERSVAA
jgi:DNA-binding Lrp family transcriptional regulator